LKLIYCTKYKPKTNIVQIEAQLLARRPPARMPVAGIFRIILKFKLKSIPLKEIPAKLTEIGYLRCPTKINKLNKKYIKNNHKLIKHKIK
jgi:hypothetical protein